MQHTQTAAHLTPDELQARRTRIRLRDRYTGEEIQPGHIWKTPTAAEVYRECRLTPDGRFWVRTETLASHRTGVLTEHDPEEFNAYGEEVYDAETVALTIEAAAGHILRCGWSPYEHDDQECDGTPAHRCPASLETALSLAATGRPAYSCGPGIDLFEAARDVIETHLQAQLPDYDYNPDRSAEEVADFLRTMAEWLRAGHLPLTEGQDTAPVPKSQRDEIHRTAEFHPARADEPGTLPSLEVAGAMVFVYVTDSGELAISVDLETINSALTGPDGTTVPLHVSVQGTTVYRATSP